VNERERKREYIHTSIQAGFAERLRKERADKLVLVI
jgi:hypothetical protein